MRFSFDSAANDLSHASEVISKHRAICSSIIVNGPERRDVANGVNHGLTVADRLIREAQTDSPD
jgi:hypothetical protein